MLLPSFTRTNIINVFAPCNASKLLISYLATHGGQLSVTFEWKDFQMHSEVMRSTENN